MNLATLLSVIDYEEQINIVDYVDRNTIYKGMKYYTDKHTPFDADVFGVYTKDGYLTIEVR